MAIVFSEGHLLLFVRYTVIIFQSIKRLYLAQLAACTKVKESASPPFLFLVVTAHINEQMQRERRREGWQRGSDRARYSFSCALSSGSIWNISVKRKHSYTLHRTLPVSSHLNLRWPSAAPFCFCSAGAFSDRIFPERERQLRQRERPHLCCFVWIRADVASTKPRTKQEFQLFSRERNPQTQFTTEMLTYKATKSWANSSALNSIVFLNNTLPWLNKAEKKKERKEKSHFFTAPSCNFSKKARVCDYLLALMSFQTHMLLLSRRNSKRAKSEGFYNALFLTVTYREDTVSNIILLESVIKNKIKKQHNPLTCPLYGVWTLHRL